jgi:hypothetical protein
MGSDAAWTLGAAMAAVGRGEVVHPTVRSQHILALEHVVLIPSLTCSAPACSHLAHRRGGRENPRPGGSGPARRRLGDGRRLAARRGRPVGSRCASRQYSAVRACASAGSHTSSSLIAASGTCGWRSILAAMCSITRMEKAQLMLSARRRAGKGQSSIASIGRDD